VDRLPAGGSVFADFLQATYGGQRTSLPWNEIVLANEYTLAAQEAAESGQVVAIQPRK
jgi:hypothetical protein